MTLREHATDGTEQMVVPEPATITVETARFGAIEIQEQNRFAFPTGIPGFPGARELYLFPNPGGGCFEWLHAGDGSALGFAVLAPDEALFDVIKDQARKAARLLSWGKTDEVEMRLIVTIPAGSPEHATINLRAPVLLNRTRNVGAQPILTDETLPYRLPLFPDAPAPSNG